MKLMPAIETIACPCGAPPGAICKKLDCLMLKATPLTPIMNSPASEAFRCRWRDNFRSRAFWRAVLDGMAGKGLFW